MRDSWKMRKRIAVGAVYGILFAVLLSGCGSRARAGENEAEHASEDTDSGIDDAVDAIKEASKIGQYAAESGGDSDVEDRIEGTSTDTLATPEDFPAAYNYGDGTLAGWSRSLTLKKMPEPAKASDTVLHASVDPTAFQAFYLWEEGNMPAETDFTSDMAGYYDSYDFRPFVTAIPVREDVTPKGAVVLMAGGAYQFRGNYTDTLPTAAQLRELGFRTFIVDYRLSPYTQQEGALDVARSVRFIRKNADIYGIDPEDVAVMGYSAGGIQAGQFLMGFDEDVTGSALDPDYTPDSLDAVPAHASADGMIYSFYGRLSHGTLDEEALRDANLPPTFFVYGTDDPFYSQFEAQYALLKDMGIAAGRIVLDGWPHGFGGDGGWVEPYAAWLETVFGQ